MIKLKTAATGLLLAITSAFAVTSCINEEYSIKNIDDSMTILPGLSFKQDVHYDISLPDGMGFEVYSGGRVDTDSNGNYILHAYSPYTNEETAVCTFHQWEVPDSGPFSLAHAALTMYMNEGVIARLYEYGARLHTPLQFRIENTNNVEGQLSIILTNLRNESMTFSDIELNPGTNEFTLDSEALTAFLEGFWQQAVSIDFFLTPKDGKLPAEECSISTNVRMPVELMPQQEFKFEHIVNIWNGSINVEDIPNTLLNSHAVISMNLSIENSIPAELTIETISRPELGFSFSIEGMKPIPAGTPDAPSITEMTWKVDASDGLSRDLLLNVTAKIAGDEPIPVCARYGLKFNMTSIKFENGI